MAIYNDCKIVIDLNKLVKARPCGVDLADEHVDNIANDLRRRMTFDSLFEQVDRTIWDYAEECNIDLNDSEECQSFGFQIPQYGDTQPKPGREAELVRREKEAKERKKYFEENFEMVDLEGGSWTIQVPRRKINNKNGEL
tara:strand:+ start:147 stop:566 length:420 start_codon:yes stop_codon:yes gene_type:complete